MWFLQKKEKGSLGASPDGLIKDPSRKDPHGIFEAKYIILKDGESLKDALLVFSLYTGILHSLLSTEKPMAQFPV